MGRQLSLLAIKNQTYEDAADEFYALVRDVIENIGVLEFAGSVGCTPRAVYQALSRRKNRKVPIDWLPVLLDLDREGRIAKFLADLAQGDFVPRDRRTDADKLAALQEQVTKFGEAGFQMLRAAGLK